MKTDNQKYKELMERGCIAKLNCHCGTKKEEVKEFLSKYPDKLVNIHFEGNLYNHWGDDMDYVVVLHETGMKSALETVDECYIHNVYIYENENEKN